MIAHNIVVPPMAGIAPYCSCGWPETEGGKRFVWRYGDKSAAEHLTEVAPLMVDVPRCECGHPVRLHERPSTAACMVSDCPCPRPSRRADGEVGA